MTFVDPTHAATALARDVLGLAETCRKLGRDTEAAFWLIKAVENGHWGAIEEVAKLFLEKPAVAAVFPLPLLNLLQAVLHTIPEPERRKLLPYRFLERWKTERADTIAADKAMPVRERVLKLKELRGFDQVIAMVEDALKSTPKDARLLAELGSLLTERDRWSDSARAYQRSLELDPDSEDAAKVVPAYLKALLISGRADEVLAEAARLDERGWKPRGEVEQSQGLTSVVWGIRSIAAAVAGKDHAAALSKATSAMPAGRGKGGDWQQFEEWAKTAPIPQERRKTVDAIVRELRTEKPAGLVGAKNSRLEQLFEEFGTQHFAVILLHGKNSMGN